MDNKLIDILRLLNNSGMTELLNEFQKNFEQQKELLDKVEREFQIKILDDVSNGKYENLDMYKNILNGIKEYGSELISLKQLDSYFEKNQSNTLTLNKNNSLIKFSDNLTYTKPIKLILNGKTYELESKTWVGVLSKLFEILSQQNPNLFYEYIESVNNEWLSYCRFYKDTDKPRTQYNSYYLKNIRYYYTLAGDANAIGKLGLKLLKLFNLESSCFIHYIPREKTRS